MSGWRLYDHAIFLSLERAYEIKFCFFRSTEHCCHCNLNAQILSNGELRWEYRKSAYCIFVELYSSLATHSIAEVTKPIVGQGAGRDKNSFPCAQSKTSQPHNMQYYEIYKYLGVGPFWTWADSAFTRHMASYHEVASIFQRFQSAVLQLRYQPNTETLLETRIICESTLPADGQLR